MTPFYFFTLFLSCILSVGSFSSPTGMQDGERTFSKTFIIFRVLKGLTYLSTLWHCVFILLINSKGMQILKGKHKCLFYFVLCTKLPVLEVCYVLLNFTIAKSKEEAFRKLSHKLLNFYKPVYSSTRKN